MKIIKTLGVIGVVLALLAIVAALLPSSAATASESASDGGIIKPVKSQRLISGTNYMATDPLSTFVSAPAYVGDHGAVQYQIKVEIPDDEILGPRTITWTPQFSLEPLASGVCASVTQWFDGTAYQQLLVDSVPVAWEPLPVSARTIGSGLVGFETQALGNCTRVKIVIGAPNVTITGTIDIRAINRQ